MTHKPVERIPAEVFPLAELLGEEMEARGWTTDDVAVRMGGSEAQIAKNMLIVMLLLSVQKVSMEIGDDTLAALTRAFDVDSEFFWNIDNAWRRAPVETRRFYSPPEKLFGPISRRGFIRAV